MSLQGKIAVVTGGSRGIGRTISQRLAEQGAFVYINYVSRPDSAEETIKLIKESGGSGGVVQFDVSDFSATQDAFKHIISESGAVDILVMMSDWSRFDLYALDEIGLPTFHIILCFL